MKLRCPTCRKVYWFDPDQILDLGDVGDTPARPGVLLSNVTRSGSIVLKWDRPGPGVSPCCGKDWSHERSDDQSEEQR